MKQVCVIDTETTGTDPDAGGIVEIGASMAGTHERFNELCNPGISIPPEASAVHHLTDRDVQDAQAPREVVNGPLRAWLPDLRDDGMVWAAHNAPFDKSFLQPLATVFTNRDWICTWRCAMHIWPDAPGYGNQTLRYWLGLDVDVPPGLAPHRALYDAIVTRDILEYMLEAEVRSIDELVHLSTQPVLQKKVGFGKHYGELWEQVPASYLRWILGQDFDEDVTHTARHWLQIADRT